MLRRLNPDPTLITDVQQTEFSHEGRCCIDRRVGRSNPRPFRTHLIRTEIGRPSSSMRFKTRTATATSVVRRLSLRKRSPSPSTCLYRPMAVSTRLLLVYPDTF